MVRARPESGRSGWSSGGWSIWSATGFDRPWTLISFRDVYGMVTGGGLWLGSRPGWFSRQGEMMSCMLLSVL